jgi:hypothetical protein
VRNTTQVGTYPDFDIQVTMLSTGFLLVTYLVHLSPEGGGIVFLQNVSELLIDYMASHIFKFWLMAKHMFMLQ